MSDNKRTDNYYIYDDDKLSLSTRLSIISVDIEALKAKVAAINNDIELLERKREEMKKEELEYLEANTKTNAKKSDYVELDAKSGILTDTEEKPKKTTTRKKSTTTTKTKASESKEKTPTTKKKTSTTTTTRKKKTRDLDLTERKEDTK